VTWVLAVFFVLVWAGATLLIDAYIRRDRRRSLTDRLLPYQPPSLADEISEWLSERQ
jgi:hypothetical protein